MAEKKDAVCRSKTVDGVNADDVDATNDIECRHSRTNRVKKIFTKFFKKCTTCKKRCGILQKIVKCKDCGMTVHNKCLVETIELDLENHPNTNNDEPKHRIGVDGDEEKPHLRINSDGEKSQFRVNVDEEEYHPGDDKEDHRCNVKDDDNDYNFNLNNEEEYHSGDNWEKHNDPNVGDEEEDYCNESDYDNNYHSNLYNDQEGNCSGFKDDHERHQYNENNYSHMDRLFNSITPCNIVTLTQLLILDMNKQKDALYVIELLFKKVQNHSKLIPECTTMCSMLILGAETVYDDNDGNIMIPFRDLLAEHCKHLFNKEINETSTISKEIYTFIGELYNSYLIPSDIIHTFVLSILSDVQTNDMMSNICYFLKIVGENLEQTYNFNRIIVNLEKHILSDTSYVNVMEVVTLQKTNWNKIVKTQEMPMTSDNKPVLPLDTKCLTEETNIETVECKHSFDDIPTQLKSESKDDIIKSNDFQDISIHLTSKSENDSIKPIESQEIPIKLRPESENDSIKLIESQAQDILIPKQLSTESENNNIKPTESQSNLTETETISTPSVAVEIQNIDKKVENIQTSDDQQQWAIFENKISDFFRSLPERQATERDFGRIAKLCGCPLYLRKPLFIACGGGCQNNTINQNKFLKYWKDVWSRCSDLSSKLIRILSRNSVAKYVTPEHFEILVSDVINSHPDMTELKRLTSYYHSIYTRTVISRIFYDLNSSWSGKIDALEIQNSRFINELESLEKEHYIDRSPFYFNYKHFLVIYNSFRKLDRYNNMIINKNDLKNYNNYALNSRIIESLFSSNVVKRKINSGKGQEFMTYEEFVWFLLAEEDKKHPRAVEYWFKCMDVDNDGFLNYKDLKYYYEEQFKRMSQMNLTCVPPMKYLPGVYQVSNQFLEMANRKLENKMSLEELKTCKNIVLFINKFVNAEKYVIDYEELDAKLQNNTDKSDWEKFIDQEYNNYFPNSLRNNNQSRRKRGNKRRSFHNNQRKNLSIRVTEFEEHTLRNIMTDEYIFKIPT